MSESGDRVGGHAWRKFRYPHRHIFLSFFRYFFPLKFIYFFSFFSSLDRTKNFHFPHGEEKWEHSRIVDRETRLIFTQNMHQFHVIQETEKMDGKICAFFVIAFFSRFLIRNILLDSLTHDVSVNLEDLFFHAFKKTTQKTFSNWPLRFIVSIFASFKGKTWQ